MAMIYVYGTKLSLSEIFKDKKKKKNLSEIIRFIDVCSHLSTLYVVLYVRKIATQANNWI
jgi:hypothetical protein